MDRNVFAFAASVKQPIHLRAQIMGRHVRCIQNNGCRILDFVSNHVHGQFRPVAFLQGAMDGAVGFRKLSYQNRVGCRDKYTQRQPAVRR